MQIAYTDNGTGRVLIAHPAPGITPEQAAEAIALAPGSWRVVTPEEAAQLTAPTPEELAAQRVAEIKARLAELDAASIRPLRAIVEGYASPEDAARLNELDAEAAELREELQGLVRATTEDAGG